jgi:hypothetical protein
VYREAGTIWPVARTFLARSRRIAFTIAHVLGSRTVVVLGLILAAWTGYGAAKSLWLVLSGRIAEGVVVWQIEELPSDFPGAAPPSPDGKVQGTGMTEAQRLYRAVVRFEDGGRSFDVAAQASAHVRLYPTGSKVDVIFPPGRPDRARLRSELPDSWAQAGLLLVATMLGAGSARLWWRLARRWTARRGAADRERVAEAERVVELEGAAEPEHIADLEGADRGGANPGNTAEAGQASEPGRVVNGEE